MKNVGFILGLLVLLIFTISLSFAQDGENPDSEECAVANNDAIIEEVGNRCSGTGANQICYGNDDVQAVPKDGVENFSFDAPGATASVSAIRSLFLSEVNNAENKWGVAQLQLIVNQGNGTQDVTMLLFGDVEIENQSADFEGIETTIKAEAAPIYPVAPSQGFPEMVTLDQGTTVSAIARLQNGIWVRIRVPETGDVGWVLRTLLDLESDDTRPLPVEDGNQPHFGGMQAFSYLSGSNPNCGDTVTDGLLIQTPEGQARVSFLINEVTIELTSATSGASAFIQANPETGQMDVNVLDGTAYVSTDPAIPPERVPAGSQTAITIDTSNIGSGLGSLRPVSPPSQALPLAPQQVQSFQAMPAMPVVRDPERDFVPENTIPISRSQAIQSGSNDLVVNNTATVNVTNSGSNNSGGTSNNNNSSTSNNNTTSNNTTTDSGNDSQTTVGENPNTNGNEPNVDLPNLNPNSNSSSSSSSNNANNDDDEEEREPLGLLFIIGGIAIGVLAIVAIGWLIYVARRSSH